MSNRSVVAVCLIACAITVYVSLSRTSVSPAADAAGAAAPVYAQLSSPVTQDPKGTTPPLVEMTSNDAINGLGHSDKEKTAEVVVKTPGVYFIVAAAQVGKDGPADAGDYIDLWIKQNGADVANSNTRQSLPDPKFTAVLVCQGIAECKAGDVFNVAVAASGPGKGIGVKAIKPANEPVVPSVIFSMYKIN